MDYRDVTRLIALIVGVFGVLFFTIKSNTPMIIILLIPIVVLYLYGVFEDDNQSGE